MTTSSSTASILQKTSELAMEKEITALGDRDAVVTADLEKQPGGSTSETSMTEEESSEDPDGSRDIHGVKVR
jgi:hypothetical protein